MQYPVYKASEALLTLQEQKPDQFHVDRYHFDTEIQSMNELILRMRALYVAEIPYLFQPPTLETVLTEEELILSRKMQDLWITFAHQMPLSVKERIPNVNEAIIFTTDHQIQFGEGVRLSKDALAFWSKNEEPAIQKCLAQLL